MGLRVPPVAIRLTIGALLGAFAWPALRFLLPVVPDFPRFVLTWALFTFGPGVILAAWLTRNLDRLSGVILSLGVGSAAVAALIDGLGHLGLVAIFPYLATALSGAGIAVWWGSASRVTALSTKDATACLVLLALCATLGVLVFGNRLATTHAGLMLYGDYDSADLAYYAAEASEATHTVPPTASYYSGHKLNAAYYPHLVLAMVHRFADVPIMPIYFHYAWPAFLALGALVGYALVRLLAPLPVALLAIVLILLGSDFSYLAAWFLPHETLDWDFVLWPTNFLSPTMHVLHFNTWGPSMPVFVAALYALVRGLQGQSSGWLVLGAFLIAVLFEFKPFAYIVVMAALGAALVFSGHDWTARRRLAIAIGATVLFTVPLILDIFALDPADRRSQLVIDFFLLPKRMLIKLGLVEWSEAMVARLMPWAPLRTPLLLLVATVVFLVVGTGIRWFGAPGVWRAVRGRMDTDVAAWRVLGWCVIAGLGIPFVLTTQPYVDTINFYLTGLYVMWIFTAAALVRFAQRHGPAGRAAVAVAVLATLPSSVHFLARKWNDSGRPPRASLSHGELTVAQYMKTTDPETTVLLHDRPLAPSLMTVISERRIVLGWDVRYSAVGGEDRLNDVNFFYASADGEPDEAIEILRRYHVTHVLVGREGNRVHPAVLERLTLLMRSGDVSLYAVPEEIRR
ncbi:MAG TPA: hypothetical protein VES67_14280 [Vicinamibacterales bacterium]|nr:hypothetical protein [Vicinamibacterales bacterium]